MEDGQDNSGTGEIRMPKLIIPLGVDSGELEVYLETLKNSSMVKGSSNDAAAPLLSQPVTNATTASGEGTTGSTANIEALVAGVRIDLGDILRETQRMSGMLEVIMGNMNG